MEWTSQSARSLAWGWLLAACIGLGATAQETVKIYRDALGIGHVYADTDEAVAYGLGRLHFRDRPVRTMMNLSLAAGNLLETVGQRDPNVALDKDPFFIPDARALRRQRAARARALEARYRGSSSTAEERTIQRLVTAFVRGVNDERMARPANLSSYFVQHASSLASANRLTQTQYDALFNRTVATWEPYALGLHIVISQWDAFLESHGGAAASSIGRLMPSGSNAFAIPSGGSATGHTYLFSDSHQQLQWYVSLRFKARHGQLDGGGFTVSGYPFLLMGFGRNVAWTMTLSGGTGSFTGDIFDGDDTSAPGSWIDELGTSRPIINVVDSLKYRLTPSSPVATTLLTHRFLDANRTRHVTVVRPGSGEHPHRIWASRTTLGDPAPPSPNDPGHETEKMFHRFLVAADADAALSRGLDATLSASGIYITFTDAVRGVTVQADRTPYRAHETPYEATWRSTRQSVNRSGQGPTWVIRNGRHYHPVTAFPIVRSDGTTPVRNGKPLKFWANCNSGPIWLLGLQQPLGQPGPDADIPYDDAHPDYVSPFDRDTLRLPTGAQALRHVGPPWGVLTRRQEWVTSLLKASWAKWSPGGIPEADLRAIMVDHRAPLPILLEQSGFFASLESIATTGASHLLAFRMRAWAQRSARYSVTVAADAQDAARFHVFWWFFRREANGPWSRNWTHPHTWEFVPITIDPFVTNAAQKALTATSAIFALFPSLDLTSMKRFAIPFGGPNVPVPGIDESGHVTGAQWVTTPGPSAPPLIDAGGGGRMPMLIRMRKTSEPHHKVVMMTPAHAGRVKTLPEWIATKGPAFHAAPLAWASAVLTDMPMTEAALLALGYDPQVTLTMIFQR